MALATARAPVDYECLNGATRTIIPFIMCVSIVLPQAFVHLIYYNLMFFFIFLKKKDVQ